MRSTCSRKSVRRLQQSTPPDSPKSKWKPGSPGTWPAEERGKCKRILLNKAVFRHSRTGLSCSIRDTFYEREIRIHGLGLGPHVLPRPARSAVPSSSLRSLSQSRLCPAYYLSDASPVFHGKSFYWASRRDILRPKTLASDFFFLYCAWQLWLLILLNVLSPLLIFRLKNSESRSASCSTFVGPTHAYVTWAFLSVTFLF